MDRGSSSPRRPAPPRPKARAICAVRADMLYPFLESMPMKAAPHRLSATALLFVVLALPPLLRAQADDSSPGTFVGFSLCRFQVGDEVFKEVYGEGGSMAGLTVSQKFFGVRNLTLAAALDLRRFSRQGVSTVSQVDTKFGMTPVVLGVEASLRSGVVLLWFGAGLGLTFYREESDLQTTSGSTLGLRLAGGLAFQPLPAVPLRLKLVLGWTKAKTTENGLPVELGGPEYGLALLYGFRLF